MNLQYDSKYLTQLADYCGVHFGGPKAVTDPAYSLSFFFSIKKKKKPLKAKLGSDEDPEDPIIMESYNTTSSHEPLTAWKWKGDNVHTSNTQQIKP